MMIRSRVAQAASTVRLTLAIAVAIVAVLTGLYLALLHPWLMSWGATVEEQQMALPGDAPGSRPSDYMTRAISIDATPSEVWAWLLQIGQDRAGFYSNTWLENLFAGDIHNGDQIRPKWQERAVGDRVPMSGPEGEAVLGDVTKLTVRVL